MPSPIVRRMESTSKRIKSLLPFANGGFLTNKFVLYLVLFAALFDVFHFYQRKDLKSVMIFFLVGILVSFFSKNMVVILILAIVVTHLIRYGKNLTEGFEETDETKEPEDFAAADETEATEDPDAFVGEEEEEKEKEEKEEKKMEKMANKEKMGNKTTKPEPFSEKVMDNLRSADTFLSQMDKKHKPDGFATLDQAYSSTTKTTKPK